MAQTKDHLMIICELKASEVVMELVNIDGGGDACRLEFLAPCAEGRSARRFLLYGPFESSVRLAAVGVYRMPGVPRFLVEPKVPLIPKKFFSMSCGSRGLHCSHGGLNFIVVCTEIKVGVMTC